MGLVAVDGAKCARDGICVAECPMKVIELKEGAAVPTVVDGAEARCIKCGHCVAACPHSAFALEGMPPEALQPVRKEWALDRERTEHFLRARRSIRAFRGKKVGRETLASLLDVARYAPTGANSQQVKWLVINSPEGVQRIAGHIAELMRHLVAEKHPVAAQYQLDRRVAAWDAGDRSILRQAPCLVIAHAPAAYPLAQVDCAIALSYLELAAPSFGLGTCWAGSLTIPLVEWSPLRTELGLPEGHTWFGALMVGHPKYAYHRIPSRNKASVVWRD
ncbi:MAG: nitroreductase family protein [Nitrospinae bacterium]|nr:nitroreductase family protein [Nitrospinota bacterium]